MRRLSNFIDGFMKYTNGKGSPALFRRWAAIFVLSAVCERKTWLKTVKGKTFPNQFIVLVGGPGVGKTLCTQLIRELLGELNTPETPMFLAPTSVTKASLIDALAESDRRIVKPLETPSIISYNTLTIVPNEFGVFLPSWENDFMSVMTDLWDGNAYHETRRTHKINIDVKNTNLNLFSATTPSYMNNLLPEGAWEQGFMARVLLAYSGESEVVDLFAEFDYDDELYDALVHDLREVYKIWGEMTISQEVRDGVMEWARAGGPPAPDHPKLAHYATRRLHHLVKLMMVASISTGNDRVIELEHFAEALDWLIELEATIPEIFKAMKTGGDGRAIEECWHFAYTIFMKSSQPVAEHRLVHFLQERVPAHTVGRILEVMERAHLLEKKYVGNVIGYEPKARRAA